MDKETTENYKKTFKKLLNGLLEQAENTVSVMNDVNGTFPDPTDRASLETDRSFELRIRDREHKLIKKIQKALERIDEGTFGLCETCLEEISSKRLEARPVTTQCIECKTREEAVEKSLGL